MQDAKPAGVNGGHREIQITDWRAHSKNNPKSFFTATLPSGPVLHDLALHERGGARWVGLPAREWISTHGERQYSSFIEFANRASAGRFRDAVLSALDGHLESLS